MVLCYGSFRKLIQDATFRNPDREGHCRICQKPLGKISRLDHGRKLAWKSLVLGELDH